MRKPMATKRPGVYVVAGLVSVAATTWILYSRFAIAPTRALTPANEVSLSAAPAIPPKPAGVSAQIATRPADQIAPSLSSTYRNLPSIGARSFLEQALRQPEAEGAYYAMRVLTHCRDLAVAPEFVDPAHPPYETNDPEYTAKVRATEVLRANCRGLLPSDVTIQHEQEVTQQIESRDPVLRAINAYIAASKGFSDSPDAAPARLRATLGIMELADPQVVDDLGLRLVLYRSSDSKRYAWFGGKSYGLDDEVDVGGAIYLLPCGLGLACDLTDHITARRCASGAGCDASRYDYLKRIYAERPGMYEKVLAMSEAMAREFRNRNAEAFVRSN